MQTRHNSFPNPFLVSPVEMAAATLPCPDDSELTQRRRESLACNLRNAGRAAIVLAAGLATTGISEHNHGPYSSLGALVAIAGASRFAYTYMQAGITTSGLIAGGYAETFDQMLVMPGDLPPAAPDVPPITPPGVE